MMHREEHFHVSFTDGICNQANQIKFWTHIFCVPWIHFACPHWKAVVMFCYRSGKFSTCISKKLCPFFRIEFASFRFELRCKLHKVALPVFSSNNEVVVRPFRWIPIHLLMMLILRSSFNVYITWIPFIWKCRDRIYSPMKINTKFSVFEPLWNRVYFLQRFKTGLEFLFLILSKNLPTYCCNK